MRCLRLTRAVLPVLLSSAVQADDALLWQESLFTLPLEDLLQQEVTVASKVSEPYQQAAASVTVFNREQILQLGAQTVEELLAFVPGISVTRSAETGARQSAIAVRGRREAQHNMDILVLLDGQRLNSELFGGTSVINQDLPTDHLAQVEVIRGPGSALYGSNAFLAVVNLITDPTLQEVSLHVGDHQQQKWFAASHTRVGDWQLSGSLHHAESSGATYTIDDGVHGSQTTRDPERHWEAYARIEGHGLIANVRYNQIDLNDFVISRFVDDTHNTVEGQFLMGNLSYRWLDTPTQSLTTRLDLSHGDQTLLLGFLPGSSAQLAGLSTTADDLLAGSRQHFKTHEFSLDWSYRGTPGHTLLAGLNWRQHEESASRAISNYPMLDLINGLLPITPYGAVIDGPDLLTAVGRREVAGIYLQEQWQLTPQWMLQGGVRLDHYSDLDDQGELIPRLAAVYQPSKERILKAMYGEAFRAPTRQELLSNGLNFAIGSEALKPEVARTGELAWIERFDHGSLSTTLFHTSIEQIIQIDLEPRVTGGIQAVVRNGATAEFSGIELEGQWQLHQHWNLRTSLTQIDKQDIAVQNAPRRLLNGVLSYQYSNWQLNVSARYHSAVEGPRVSGDASQTLDSFWLVGASVYYRLDPQLTLELEVDNLLDRDYQTYSGQYNTRNGALANGLPGQPRNLLVGLRWRW